MSCVAVWDLCLYLGLLSGGWKPVGRWGGGGFHSGKYMERSDIPPRRGRKGGEERVIWRWRCKYGEGLTVFFFGLGKVFVCLGVWVYEKRDLDVIDDPSSGICITLLIRPFSPGQVWLLQDTKSLVKR